MRYVRRSLLRDQYPPALSAPLVRRGRALQHAGRRHRSRRRVSDSPRPVVRSQGPAERQSRRSVRRGLDRNRKPLMDRPSVEMRAPRSLGRTLIGAVILAVTFGGALAGGALL